MLMCPSGTECAAGTRAHSAASIERARAPRDPFADRSRTSGARPELNANRHDTINERLDPNANRYDTIGAGLDSNANRHDAIGARPDPVAPRGHESLHGSTRSRTSPA